MLSDERVAELAGQSIWVQLDALVAAGSITIDRPGGTPHPKISEYVYPLDYGFVDDTRGGDGSGIDVFVGTETDRRVTGILATFDAVKRDAEVKVLWACSPAEIDAVDTFYRPQPQAVLVIRREGADS